MAYKVIGDSCLDLTEDMKKDSRSQMIPLTLQAGSARVVNDKTFDQKWFIEMVKACPECPKTACPSPETFRTAFGKAEAEAVFAITLSSHLSGGYNSAAVAKKLYGEEMAEKGMAEQTKKVIVTGSLSASSGELNVALLIQNLCDSGLEFDEVMEKALVYRGDMNTYFVLESLSTFRRNGHLSGLQAFFATTLNIKPVMDADTGTTIRLNQARGMNRALRRICDIAVKEVADAASKVAVVYHVSSPERAEYVKDELAKRVGFRKTVITNTAGVATVYANDGEVVLIV